VVIKFALLAVPAILTKTQLATLVLAQHDLRAGWKAGKADDSDDPAEDAAFAKCKDTLASSLPAGTTAGSPQLTLTKGRDGGPSNVLASAG